ncbi:D-lactonohydrolase-like protein-like protein [Podospora didyma]|uniref:D-lactonohydrolase-like protein-like protein n=1 Tax=Podospora didyma TaxID=330526 RepID=A0AAE0NX02_9PEZI|nr:D-lactonohydrolase-like protein-like protein [Podospora didyma]
MAAVTKSVIPLQQCKVELIDLRGCARRSSPRPLKSHDQNDISVTVYHGDMAAIVGTPSFCLLLSSHEASNNPFFHEACAYRADRDELYMTSSLLKPARTSDGPIVLISKVKLTRNDTRAIVSVEWQKLRPPQNMPMPAGGAAYHNGVLFCSQGTLADGTGGLYYMPYGQPPEPVVTNFFGRDFNSPHSVVVARDGSMWFTDPPQGFERAFRANPVLPCHVYRYVPETGDLRVMADDLGRPHGIALSPDESTVYVTNTTAVRADGSQDLRLAATTYAFDIIKRFGSPFLTNRRIFAFSMTGVPMGIICDTRGNVYAGCADGVEIFSPGGEILGVIEVPGGVTSLFFGRSDELFLCAEQRLWLVRIGVKDDHDLLS